MLFTNSGFSILSKPYAGFSGLTGVLTISISPPNLHHAPKKTRGLLLSSSASMPNTINGLVLIRLLMS